MRERQRDRISAQPGDQYWEQRLASGWKPVAVEWEREVTTGTAASAKASTPFGTQVSGDCQSLEENPAEMKAMMEMLELIIQERPFPEVAVELSRRGHRRRDGQAWSPGAVFEMLPRLIEAGPRIYSSAEWATRRTSLVKAIRG